MTKQHPYTDYQRKSNNKIVLVIVVVGMLISGLIVALLFAIATSDPKPIQTVKSDEVIDLLETPSNQNVDSVDMTSTTVGIELPEGGWVQQTDTLGNLVQQYRCETLEPNPPNLPDGWIEMKRPEVELYLSDDKVIKITGDTGIANAPRRILESGEIAGHVRVEMFENNPQRSGLQELPTMILTTPQVSFDNFIGEITCNSEIHVESTTLTLSGRKLTVRLNDLEGRIDFLRLEEVNFIDLYQMEREILQLAPLPSRVIRNGFSVNKKHKIRATAINAPTFFYISTLFDNVVIHKEQLNEITHATGDRLTIAFSEDRESNQVISHNTIPTTSHIIGPLPVRIASATLGIGPESIPTRITCDGGLTLVPLLEVDLMPSAREETRIEMFGTKESPVTLEDSGQNMTASGIMFRHELNQDRSEIFGSPAQMTQDNLLVEAPHVWIAKQDYAGGAEGEGVMQKSSTEQSANTTLRWLEGVDFTFNSTEDEHKGLLKQVFCRGGVELTTDLNVLTCDTLEVNFIQTEGNDSAPSIAIARDHVMAKSENQTLFADTAQVTFKQFSENDTPHNQDKNLFGSSTADKLDATGDVQVLLSDGGRAYCRSLISDISQEEATLYGDVVIAYQRMLMNKGEEAVLKLNRTTGKGQWEGSGQALFLDSPIHITDEKRIPRPVINQDSSESVTRHISMRAKWFENMKINQMFNDGAGAITLNGEVDVRSQQSMKDKSQMTGESLRLEFEQNDSTARQLSKVIAKDNAQIEHRVWETDANDTPPVVYYIGGDHVEYVPKTQETLAVGNGELVLRDPRKAEIEEHQSALAGKGTTRFTWDEKLKTTQINDEMYLIKMTGNVEMVHKGLGGSIGMLTSESIEAVAIDPNFNPTEISNVSEITLRGMDLQQLKATGTVYVATETRRVDCDVFDYNLLTGIAQLRALPRRTVSIVTDGSSYPVRADSVVWNMDPSIDSITIRGLQGSGTN